MLEAGKMQILFLAPIMD